MKKLFVIRKYIMAESAADAIRKDKKTAVEDVWIEEDWKKNNMTDKPTEIGFDQKKHD